MLVDTGPLVALVDKDDANYRRCVSVTGSLTRELFETTWPCFTEASYLLGTLGRFMFQFQGRLWNLRRTSRLLLMEMPVTEANRMDELMTKYSNVPMDLADASLVAVPESRGIRKIFTMDSDFYIYRLADGSVMEVLR